MALTAATATAPSASAADSEGRAAVPRVPVLVELFTSEGCSSCPPADDLLAELASTQPVEGVEVVPLGLHVTYWDGLGWPDAFGHPSHADRQAKYAEAFGRDGVYTPQMVVDGATGFPGGRGRAAEAIRAAAKAAGKVRVELKVVRAGKETVEVELKLPEGERRDAELVLALTESGLSSQVKRGENAGRTLRHAAVARALQVVGPAKATATARLELQPRWNRHALQVVAFVQERASRRVVGVAAVPVPPVTGS
jgi:hypothetical protein